MDALVRVGVTSDYIAQAETRMEKVKEEELEKLAADLEEAKTWVATATADCKKAFEELNAAKKIAATKKKTADNLDLKMKKEWDVIKPLQEKQEKAQAEFEAAMKLS